MSHFTSRYSAVLHEFDQYMDCNYADTIYFDAKKLHGERDFDVLATYRHFVAGGNDGLRFETVLNQPDTAQFCDYIQSHRQKAFFYKASLETIEKHIEHLDSDLGYRLNIIQIADSGAQLRHEPLMRQLNSLADHFSDPLRLSVANARLSVMRCAFDGVPEVLNLVRSDEKNDRFYTSFIQFYYRDMKSVIALASNSISQSHFNTFAQVLPVISQALRRDLVPEGTKTAFSLLQSAVRRSRREFPAEINDRFGLIDEILDVDPERFRSRAPSSKRIEQNAKG